MTQNFTDFWQFLTGARVIISIRENGSICSWRCSDLMLDSIAIAFQEWQEDSEQSTGRIWNLDGGSLIGGLWFRACCGKMPYRFCPTVCNMDRTGINHAAFEFHRAFMEGFRVHK